MAPRRRKRRIRVGAIGENALVKMVKNILTLTPVREFCHLTMSTGLMSHMRMSPKNGMSLLWMMFSFVSQVCSRTLGLTSAS